MASKGRGRFLLAVVAATAGLIVGLFFMESRNPPRELRFERVVQSPLPPSELRSLLFNLERWPEWHHELVQTRKPNENTIEMHLKPKGWKNLHLTWKVQAWEPGSRYRLELIRDSSSKLLRAFERVEMEIEARPSGNAERTEVIGRVFARARSVRIRLLSRFSERLILNQLFYPDLSRLQFESLPVRERLPPGF